MKYMNKKKTMSLWEQKMFSILRSLEKHDYHRLNTAKELGVCVHTIYFNINKLRSLGFYIPKGKSGNFSRCK